MEPMTLPSTDQPLVIRAEIAAVDRYALDGSIDGATANTLHDFIQRVAGPLLMSVTAERARIAVDATLTAAGREANAQKLEADARATLLAMRGFADRQRVAFEHFDASADRRIRLADGTWQDNATPRRMPADQGPLRREVRDRILDRDLTDSSVLVSLRAEFLRRVEEGDHDVFIDAISEGADVLKDAAFAAVLDDRTRERARELRLRRSGVWPYLERARLSAAIAESVVVRVARELNLEPETISARMAAAV